MTAKFRFERTPYGYKAFALEGAAYVYFGHFLTKAKAKRVYAEAA